MAGRHPRQIQNRERVAAEAARLFIEQGLPDFGTAKRKAARNLRLGSDIPLPDDDEVEVAVAEYQRLFQADSQPAALTELRCTALKLMTLLADFTPKLVGPVLSGIADEDSVIALHLYADPPEAVQWYLMERRVRFDTGEINIALSGGGRSERLPVYSLEFQGAAVELVVFSERQRRQRPLGGAGGRPLERAAIAELRSLMAATPTTGPAI